MIGTRILHYEIQRKLGEGGMGVVYLAIDTNLGRPVALKVLSSGSVSDSDTRRRFLHEARAQAMLNHPNITTFYEAGECDDTTFIAMEYVEGVPLSRYAGAHECRPVEVLRLAEQIAVGLAAAHAHGVIHRDIKPDNIMVLPDGRVKIMDFGLARWKGASTLTKKGTRLGSAFYMSPEQAEGRTVDQRTDIFSLGVLMYELLTRHRPFEGENEAVVLYELISSAPQPLARYCRDVPQDLERIVLKCLAKDPNLRYASAEDLATDLRRLDQEVRTGKLPSGGRPSFPRRRSRGRLLAGTLMGIVAATALLSVWRPARDLAFRTLGLDAARHRRYVVVVPFTLIGEPPRGNAFAAGLLETVTTKLTQLEPDVRSLRVIPASEVRQNRISSAHDARLAFGATHAVTGSMQFLSDLIRVTVNLVDAVREVQLNSVIIDRDSTHIAGLQDSIAYALATMLSGDLSPALRSRMQSIDTTTAASYEAYMEGLGYLHLYAETVGGTVLESRSRLDSAITRFRAALGVDSNYAECHAALGQACWHAYRLVDEEAWLDSARAHTFRAIELSPRLASAYLTLGRIHKGVGQYQEALFEYRQGLQLDSTTIDGYLGIAATYTSLKRLEDAERAYQSLLALYPDNLEATCDLALFYVEHGRKKDALKVEQRFKQLHTEGYANLTRLGAFYFGIGEYDQARGYFEQSVAVRPNYPAYNNLGTTYFILGDLTTATRMYRAALAIDDGDYRVWFCLASALANQPTEADSAQAAYRHTIRLAEEELRIDPRQSDLLSHLAECYQNVGDSARALQYADRALMLAPQNVNILVAAGVVYENLGGRDSAVRLIGSALSLGYPRKQLEALPELAGLLKDPRLNGPESKPAETEGGNN